MTYLNRNLQSKIEKLLEIFPVVLMVGARQTGKTTLAKLVRPTWKYFDLEKGSDYDFITQDYDFFFKEYPQHIIIDESQECPQIFRELRGVIDADRDQKNRFILTGSSSLTLLKGISDSLAGRVGIVEVGTLKVNELRGEGISEFYRIFEKKISGDTLLDLKNTIFQSYDSFSYLLKGGYPEPVQNKSEFAFNAWMENYHKTYIYSDVKKLFPTDKPVTDVV